MEYYWYRASSRPPADKFVNNFYGFKEKQEYMQCELYDLRIVDRCTLDELFDKYF